MYLKLLRTKLKRLPKSGEISIYLSLVFTLIISLVLTVITGARGAALQVAFECAVESALLSAFGEYDRELLERYDVSEERVSVDVDKILDTLRSIGALDE